MKLKLIAAVSCLAIASAANAAVNPGDDPTQGGELILSVWDSASTTSYTLDLGVTTRNFDGEGTYAYDLSSDENWSTFIDGAGSMIWDVVGSDRDTGAPSLNGIMASARIGTDSSVTALEAAGYNTLQTNIEQYVNQLDGLDDNFAANNSYYISGSDYAGDTGVWGSFAGNVTFATAAYGESMEFWSLTTDGYEHRGQVFAIPNHTKLAGKWTLSGDSLVYTAAAPVPVPAAVWLFGSALAGLVGVSRRKRS